jgi:hypothetical protein
MSSRAASKGESGFAFFLSEIMGPSTRALIAEVGIPTGSICLDVGWAPAM